MTPSPDAAAPEPGGRAVRTLLDIGLVGLGGAIGTLARYLANVAWGGAWVVESGSNPLVTFSINVTGAFVLGGVVAVLAVRHPRAQLFLGTGVLGGYTTYSLFAADVGGLALIGAPGAALLLGVGTVVVGLVGSFAGSALGSAIRGRLDRRRDEREGESGAAA